MATAVSINLLRSSGTAPFFTYLRLDASTFNVGSWHNTEFIIDWGDGNAPLITDPRGLIAAGLDTRYSRGGCIGAGHCYELPGTYNGTVTIRNYDPADGTFDSEDSDTFTVTVNETTWVDGTNDFYIAPAGSGGSDANAGDSSNPWETHTKVMTYIAGLGSIPAGGLRFNYEPAGTYTYSGAAPGKSGTVDNPLIFQKGSGAGADPIISTTSIIFGAISGIRVLDMDLQISSGSNRCVTPGEDNLFLRCTGSTAGTVFRGNWGAPPNGQYVHIQECDCTGGPDAVFLEDYEYISIIGGTFRDTASNEPVVRINVCEHWYIQGIDADQSYGTKHAVALRGNPQYCCLQDCRVTIGENSTGGWNAIQVGAQSATTLENQHDICIERTQLKRGASTYSGASQMVNMSGVDCLVRNMEVLAPTGNSTIVLFYSLTKNGHASSEEPTGNRLTNVSLFLQPSADLCRDIDINANVATTTVDVVLQNLASYYTHNQRHYTILYPTAGWHNSQFQCHNNYEYRPSASSSGDWSRHGSPITIKTLAQFQATGNDRGVGSALDDPEFTDPANWDFYPGATSPLKTAGTTTVGAAFEDIVGRRRHYTAGAITVGSREYFGNPTITDVSPATGPTAGGTSVTITGTEFMVGETTVEFDGDAATSVVVDPDDPTSLTCVTPAHAAGAVDVKVTTAINNVTDAGGFTYADPSPPGGGTASVEESFYEADNGGGWLL